MIILGTNSIKAAGGYNVANSLRFNDGSSDTLTRTPGSASNRRTFTISFWVKRSSVDSAHKNVFSSGAYSSTQMTQVFFEATDELIFSDFTSSPSQNFNLTTNRKFRDPSAWYHIFIAVDTTQGTASNRIKIYVNGVQETSFATESYPSQNFDCAINVNQIHTIGNRNGASLFFDGYLSEFVFVDGTAQAHTDVGEFDSDSGIWKPIDVSGLTFGTNGFYLDFEDSSALGNDAAGSNNFTVNNLTAVDQSIDTCTNNFATFNPLIKAGYQPAFAEGNLKISQGTSGSANMAAVTIGVTSGKWYCEIKKAGGGTHIHGIHAATQTSGGDFPGRASLGWGINLADGNVSHNDSASTYGASVADGDILGIALDMDNNKLYFSKNGDWSNGSGAWGSSTFNAGTGAIDISAAAAEDMMFSVSVEGSSSNIHGNFGSPAEAISSGNADGDGFGNFEFAVPSGFFSLCTKNLAEYG